MRKKLNAILFDHDGTLVDSERIHFLLWREVLRPYNIVFTEDLYKSYYAGMPTDANASDAVTRFKLRTSPSTLANEKNLATNIYLSKQAFPLMPNAKDILNYFRDLNAVIGVVTGGSRNAIQTTIKEYSLQHKIDVVVSGDDVVRSKPAPDGYLLAMDILGIGSSNCIAIEDTEHGVEAATSAGILCIAVPSPMSKEQNFNKAIVVVRSLLEAQHWITSNFIVGS